jgi:LuxR family maltose regulon positive regulatory protein
MLASAVQALGEAGMRLILDKIRIPDQAPPLSRKRLVDALKEGFKSCNSILITGRAGTGKTTLAADFARRCGRRVAWYKVDAPDAESDIFFHYLVASVARHLPDFHWQAAPCDLRTGVEIFPLLAELWAQEMQKRHDSLLIVIDDMHLVFDAEWVIPFFHRTLPLLPPEVMMMILSRSLPPAPLWRMRSKQKMCVIDESALSFTAREAEELFARYGYGAEPARLALEQSHGRAALLDSLAKRMKRTEEAA